MLIHFQKNSNSVIHEKNDKNGPKRYSLSIYTYLWCIPAPGTCVHIHIETPCVLRMYPLRHQVPGTDTRHITCTQYHKTKLTSGILLSTVFIPCTQCSVTSILFDYRYITYPVSIFGQIFAIFGLSRNSHFME